MTTKKARTEARKPPPQPPGNTTGVEMAMVEMAPLGGDMNHLPSLALPPGVYFSPGSEESVQTYLNRWITGHDMPDIDGIIFLDDVYSVSPDVLLRRHPPANTRNSDPKWWFLCHCKLQAAHGGGKGAHRGQRGVATGGYWKLEQAKKKLHTGGGEILGFSRSFGFYDVGEEDGGEGKKTRWLMEEYTNGSSLVVDGTGKVAMPALYKMYISPRDPDKKKRGRDGDEGVPMGQAVRVMVPTAYFDAIAALLPPSRVRCIGQEQLQGTGEVPPPPGAFGHFEGQFLEPPPPPGVFGHFEGQFLETAPPLDVLGQYHGHYQGQFMEVMADDASTYDESMPVNQFFASPEEQGTAEAPPAPCVRSIDVSPDDQSMTMDEIFEIFEPLEEQGSTGGDFPQPDLVPVNEHDIPQWQMMDEDALADVSWIDDYLNPK